jgi:hypothetical protein
MSYFTNRRSPLPEEIQLALGSRYAPWERLTQFIDTHYQITGD